MKADIIKMIRNKLFRGIGTINKRGLSARIVDHSKNKKETSVCPLTCPKKMDLLGIMNKSTTRCR